jgi:hypothetical protein
MIKRARLIDPQRLSLYAYVRNNPLAFVDPNGADLRLAKDLDQKGREKDRKFMVETLARLYMTERGKSFIERVDKSPIVVDITKGKLERTEINPAKPGEIRFGGQEHVTGGLTTTTTSTDPATGRVTLLAPIVGVQGTESLPAVQVTIDPDIRRPWVWIQFKPPRTSWVVTPQTRWIWPSAIRAPPAYRE